MCLVLTVGAQDERGGGAVDAGLGDGVGDDAGVVPHVGRLHLGDVEVPRLLGHKPAGVLLHERRVLIKYPAERQGCRGKGREKVKKWHLT